jgi:hypothetical protein
MPQGSNISRESGLPLSFEVINPEQIEIAPLQNRIGGFLRTWVLSPSVFQKEPLVASSRTDEVWRLSSNDGRINPENNKITLGTRAPSFNLRIVAAPFSKLIDLKHSKSLTDWVPINE